MSLLNRTARPMLAAMFVVGGLDALRHPETKVKKAEPVALPIAERVSFLPQDTETLIKINGAVQVVGGSLLAIGKFRRLAALALIGSIIPTTYAGHRFWEEEDDAAKQQQLTHFLKNLGLLGGLVLAAIDTEGAPSLSWRAKRRARLAGTTLIAGARAGETKAGSRAAQARILAADKAAHARALAGTAAAEAKSKAADTKARAIDGVAEAKVLAGHAQAKAGDVARQVADHLPDTRLAG
jgi:putative oxidoreductase